MSLGTGQAIHAGDTVYLDGQLFSFDDNTAPEDLEYSWTFFSKPVGSNATLFGADTAFPSFVADVAGTYLIDLVVTDGGMLESAIDTVEVSSNNLAPSAIAGDDQLILLGDGAYLDGSSSTDPDGDVLTYAWSITSAPAGSTAALSDVGAVMPMFVPDLAGVYVLSLTVSDFIGPGAPASVAVTASSAGEYAEIHIAYAADVLSGLGPNQVTTKGNKQAFLNFLRQAVTAIQESDTATAIDKLEKCIERTDGCETGGTPDGSGPGRDWITDCNAQAEILVCLRAALNALTL